MIGPEGWDAMAVTAEEFREWIVPGHPGGTVSGRAGGCVGGATGRLAPRKWRRWRLEEAAGSEGV